MSKLTGKELLFKLNTINPDSYKKDIHYLYDRMLQCGYAKDDWVLFETALQAAYSERINEDELREIARNQKFRLVKYPRKVRTILREAGLNIDNQITFTEGVKYKQLVIREKVEHRKVASHDEEI